MPLCVMIFGSTREATMDDPYNLKRFVDAQAPVYAKVLEELRDGRKKSHWMWFIFPQVFGLGSSWMAREYAIRSRAEAEAYLDHPILGKRLEECARLVLDSDGESVAQILGYPDDLKFCSSMTLFEEVAPENPIFGRALDEKCDRRRDQATIDRIRA